MATQFLFGLAVAWILCGVVTGFVMRRRGHDFFVWLALGSVLGPLVFPLAVENARHDSDIKSETRDRAYPGALDVLVGLDGSAESAQALRSAIGMIEASSLTVATVLDYDAHSSPTGGEMREAATQMLEAAAKTVTHPDLRSEILFGPPDEALIDFATSNGIELIVVGARGHGASEALFGSVTRKLVGGSEVPVLVGAMADEPKGETAGAPIGEASAETLGSVPVPIRNPQMRPD